MSDKITAIFDAAQALVEGARQALRDTGHPEPQTQQLYIPIIIGGRDLKIIIESGPLTEAANAIQTAQMRSKQAPTMQRDEAIRRAADLLLREAMLLKQSHTLPDQPEDWRGDEEAKQQHDDLLNVAKALLRPDE